MKKLLIIIALLTLSLNAVAADSCKAVLCLGGALKGSGNVSECRSSINSYFKIVGLKNGNFSPGRTQQKRDNFLNTCEDADNETKKEISKKWGQAISF